MFLFLSRLLKLKKYFWQKNNIIHNIGLDFWKGFYMYVRVWKFLEEYSLLLVLGALIGLFWANLSYDDYHHVGHMVLLSNSYVGQMIDGQRVLTLHYLINDVLMAFFFAIPGKEIWEGIILKNGSLKGKKALTPLVATLGGIISPVVVYLLIAVFLGSLDTLKNGWAISTSTDIAFSYLVGRLIFGSGHPAVAFLLLLAVADDALGLTILALFYPQGEIKLEWLAFSFFMSFTAYLVLNRKFKVRSFWPYLAFGALGWYGFQEAGIHPALGLLPIIPAIPHAETDIGFFAEGERHRQDTLNQFEHRVKPFVEVILFFFGLFNAGVLLSAVGDATYAVTFALLIGKPLGIFLFALLAVRILGLQLPKGMTIKDTLVVGQIAGIGFTVALFVTGVALPAGPVQDAAKMGALFSFGSAILSFALARFLGVKKVNWELSQLKTRLRPGFFF